MGEVEEAIKAEAERFIGEWFQGIERVDPEAWIWVSRVDKVSPRVRSDSEVWCNTFFTDRADPHEVKKAKHAFYLAEGEETPDLVRHEYAVRGLGEVVDEEETEDGKIIKYRDTAPVELTETRNFSIIRVIPEKIALLDLPADERADEIGRSARLLLTRGGSRDEPLFELPDSLEEGVVFSSNAAAHPMMMTAWDQRIDGGIRHGSLWFLCYKKNPQIMGFSDPGRWFDSGFKNEAGGAVFLAGLGLLAAEEDEDRTPSLAPFTARTDWTGKLANALLGKASEADLQGSAKAAAEEDDKKRRLHEAHVFLGLAAERAENTEEAKRHYQAAVEAVEKEDEEPLKGAVFLRWVKSKLEHLEADSEEQA